jgi:predicted RNase H-like HicB family nuclease
MVRYTVVLLPAPEGGYVVHVPALNDAVTEGDTVDECLANARDLIENVLAVMAERGDDIPTEIAPAITATVDAAAPVVARS